MNQDKHVIELDALLSEYATIEQGIISSKIENEIWEEEIDKKMLEIVSFFDWKIITEGFIKKVVKKSRKKKSALLSCIWGIYKQNPENTKNWMMPFVMSWLHSKDDTERYYAIQSFFHLDEDIVELFEDVLSDMILVETDMSCANQLLHVIQFKKNEKMLLTLIDVINKSWYKFDHKLIDNRLSLWWLLLNIWSSIRHQRLTPILVDAFNNLKSIVIDGHDYTFELKTYAAWWILLNTWEEYYRNFLKDALLTYWDTIEYRAAQVFDEFYNLWYFWSDIAVRDSINRIKDFVSKT
jgi:hypothetical protein